MRYGMGLLGERRLSPGSEGTVTGARVGRAVEGVDVAYGQAVENELEHAIVEHTDDVSHEVVAERQLHAS
jgi:hypothetical protein